MQRLPEPIEVPCRRTWPRCDEPGASGDHPSGEASRPDCRRSAPADADRYLIRDAQRVIESIEALVRIHNAQEEDIYEHAIAGHA